MIFRLLLLDGNGGVTAERIISAQSREEALSIARNMVKGRKGRFPRFQLWLGKHRILEPSKRKPHL